MCVNKHISWISYLLKLVKIFSFLHFFFFFFEEAEFNNNKKNQYISKISLELFFTQEIIKTFLTGSKKIEKCDC